MTEAVGSKSEKSATASTGTRSARTSAGQGTRKRLQDAALDLFWEKGYCGTSTRDVAATLGVQQASLYYHMKNKEELLHGICYSALETLIEKAEAAVVIARSPLEAIREIARNHLATTLEFQKEFSIGVTECRALGPEYRAEIEGLWSRYHMLTSSVLDDAKAGNYIRADVANKYIYTPLMCTLIWSVLWYRQGKGLSVSQLDEIFAAIYFEGAAGTKVRRNHRPATICHNLEALSSQTESIAPTHRNETYARLLDTACDLFARKGYNATSIREIADAMGIRKASLYYYISSKEDLIYEISRAALEHMRTSVKWALEQVSGPEDKLYAFITAHVVSLLQRQKWHATSNEELVTSTAEQRAEIVALRDAYEQLARKLLEEAQAAGVVRADIPSKFLGLVLFGMITHIYPWYQPSVDVVPSELGFILADLFMTGIAPEWPHRAI